MKVFVVVCLFVMTVNGNEDYGVKWEEYIASLKDLESVKKPTTPQHRSIGTNDFNITFTSPPEKATVHSLRPQDIDVVGALGDSITAGTGIDAETIAGIALQFRGLTWTAGGEHDLESSITITNILRKFNPQVKGHSVGVGFLYNTREEEDWFNVAVPGGRAHDMPDQARDLINRMKNDSRTSFENDWKLISIFIGGNDLCAIDRDPVRTAPERYIEDIKTALDLFHNELPRAIIQIIEIMEIYLLPQVADGYGAGRFCNIAQQIACEYVLSSKNNETVLQELNQINWEYQRLTEELVASGRYDTRDDFTVVVQPFFKNTVLPTTTSGEIDATYFAPDCFHFSSKGHAMGALNLWNNMFEPENQKSTMWNVSDLKCPTNDHPYIFTRMNSPTYDVMDVLNQPTECVKPTCKTIPDWSIGVLCTLLAIAAIELIALIFVTSQSNKKQAPKKKSENFDYEL